MKLCFVFSDHAVFQASCEITLRGKTDVKGEITAEIIKGDQVMSSGICEAGADGHFSVTVKTPEASLDAYSIRVKDAIEEVMINDILFGEVWFCSGQSNMELPNYNQPECEDMLARISGLPIRMYFQDYGPDDAFSMTPEYDRDGEWYTSDMSDKWRRPSALATAFALDMYERFKGQGKEIPIGVMDISWGGTQIRSWLPADLIMGDECVAEYLRKTNQDIKEETWNKCETRFQQTSALYNRRTFPISGVKVRGLLWYQGESDSWEECFYKMYAYMFKMYYRHHAALFGADPDNCPIIVSLLYPWTYGESWTFSESGESRMNYVNAALIDAAEELAGKMSFTTIADLPPIWNDGCLHAWSDGENHPIHPIHKYKLAKRMAAIAYANAYDKTGMMQKIPATPDEITIKEDKILVRFKNVGSGLHTSDGKQIRCLYIAGEDGYYIPAESRIVSCDTLEVFHPYLMDPKHVALGWSDYEIGFNLMGGDYPVAPFATNQKQGEVIYIQAKPFINHDLDAVWTFNNASAYYRPVWYPLAGSSLCYDNAFVQSEFSRSLLVIGQENEFGACVRSIIYNELDLQHYAFIEIDIHYRVPVKTRLEFVYEGNMESTVIPTESLGGAGGYFERIKADLSSLGENKIIEMRLIFETETDDPYLRFANVGKITLGPKKEL